jgi:hypothetical protein
MKTLSVIVTVMCLYLLGVMTGYAVGYNDNYTETVMKYKGINKRR